MIPKEVIQIRGEICRSKNCPHKIDYADPCASCPEGHWGRYSAHCEQQKSTTHEIIETAKPVPIARFVNKDKNCKTCKTIELMPDGRVRKQ